MIAGGNNQLITQLLKSLLVLALKWSKTEGFILRSQLIKDSHPMNLPCFMLQQTHEESVKTQNRVIIIPHMDNSTVQNNPTSLMDQRSKMLHHATYT